MTFPYHRSLLSTLVCAGVLAGFIAKAADAPPAQRDPKAHELLGEVAKAYQGLTAYSDQGEFVHSVAVSGKTNTQTLPIHVTFARPNKLDVDTGEVRVVCDGKTLTTIVGPFKKYTTAPAPKTITFETFRDGPLGSLLFGGPSAPTSALFFSLLSDPEAVKGIVDAGGTLKLEPEKQVDGKALQPLLIDLPQGADFRLLVDPATKLLKGIDWVIDGKEAAAEAPPGESFKIERIGWSAGKVSTEVPKENAFGYKPPAGFTKVEAIDRAAAGGGAPKAPILELVGKPAPDFTMTVLEAADKTRTISKADLAGKVVLIDFWATWCAPCLEELPEIQKLVDHYVKEGKDVVIIAQSVDQKPRDLAELRTLVEKTFKERKVTLSGNKVALTALDPSGTLSEAFSVEAIPSLVILDRKGIVEAAYVGQQTHETLAKDIDTLLAGKSLLAPKADGK